MMKIVLPDEVELIIEDLEKNGHEAYAVGGCVRDSILGFTPKDWDITTSARPDEIKKIFPRTIDTGIEHGTVTVLIGKNGFEVTTYRVDGKYKDGRHPESVEFTPSLLEDLKRRDFTINAMAYNEKNGLIDEFGGRLDLKNGIIRSVGDPRKRFSEDGLRMMRAIRFSARLGFKIDSETYDAIKELHTLIRKISFERIRDEFMKTITSPNPGKIRDFYLTGLTKEFFPEWDRMEETDQNTIHHLYTVGEHTIKVMEGVSPDARLRLAAALHDIGKPDARTTKNGKDHFMGHGAIGEKIAVKVMKRFKFDNSTIKYVALMVRYHDIRPADSLPEVRRVIHETGKEIYPELFELKRADIMAQSSYMRKEKLNLISNFEKNYNIIINRNEATSVKELAVSGRDLMDCGVKSGPFLGQVLDYLLDLVMDDPGINNKEKLLTEAKKYIEKH